MPSSSEDRDLRHLLQDLQDISGGPSHDDFLFHLEDEEGIDIPEPEHHSESTLQDISMAEDPLEASVESPMSLHNKSDDCELSNLTSSTSSSQTVAGTDRVPREHNGPATPAPFQCETCNIDFENLSHYRSAAKPSLEVHRTNIVRRHARAHDRPHHCPVARCTNSFAYAKDLKRHLSTKHSNERPFLCPYKCCKFSQRGFKREDNRLRHMQSAHPRCSLE